MTQRLAPLASLLCVTTGFPSVLGIGLEFSPFLVVVGVTGADAGLCFTCDVSKQTN
jgi:hypothetical protein